jgi:hypothetical protein
MFAAISINGKGVPTHTGRLNLWSVKRHMLRANRPNRICRYGSFLSQEPKYT